MQVRNFTPADQEACLTVFDSNVPEFFAPAEREEFAAFLDALPGPYLVLEDRSGTVLGCAGYAITPGAATADLCWGMVVRERHGSGLGGFLLDERLARIRAGSRIEAIVLHTSQHTRGFYERLGFVTEQIVSDGYAPGLDRCDMRLVLRPGRA